MSERILITPAEQKRQLSKNAADASVSSSLKTGIPLAAAMICGPVTPIHLPDALKVSARTTRPLSAVILTWLPKGGLRPHASSMRRESARTTSAMVLMPTAASAFALTAPGHWNN